MRNLIMLCLIACLSLAAHAQKSGQTDFELGVSGGTSWYNGDLNPTVHFGRNYMNRAFGLSLRRNLNQRFALRWQLNYGEVGANDIFANTSFRRNRNLNFSSPIIEFSNTIEFNFLPWDALVDKYRFSPYSFIGLSGFYFNPSTEVENSIFELQPNATEGKDYSRYNVAVPFGFGFKLAITDRLLLSAEWGLRRTFTDYLDDVSAFYPDEDVLDGLAEDLSDRSLEQAGPDGTNWGTQRGNELSKDWFTFAMATLSIRLGPKKGSCKHLRI
jgi:hypothetical protein